MARRFAFACVALCACGLFPSLDGLSSSDGGSPVEGGGGDVTVLPDATAPEGGEAGEAAPPVAHYKRVITIHDTAQAPLPVGYTIGVPFAESELQAAINAGQMRSDLADLRLVGPGGERDRIVDAPPLARMVWFSLPSAISAGATDTSFEITYGDPNASAPPANGAAVFGFYDDFPGTSLDSHWMSQGGTSVSGGFLTLPKGLNGALTTVAEVPQTTMDIRAKVVDPTSQPDGNTGFYYWFGFQHTGDFDASQPWIVWIARDVNIVGAEDNADGCPSGCNSATLPQTTGFRVYGIERQPSTTIFTIDGAPGYTTAATNDQSLSLMIRNFLVSSDLVVDWIRSRTVVYPAPTVTLGPEQTF